MIESDAYIIDDSKNLKFFDEEVVFSPAEVES
jgi:hypothetical protein